MVSRKIGTENALTELARNIYTNLKQKNKTLRICMDISKAFDYISHIKLLNTFMSLSIVRKLLKSYLYNRNQEVRILNILSKELVINNGIPQSKMLSPFLYIIYVNALKNWNLQAHYFLPHII